MTLKEIAKKAVTLSELMDGREKLSTEDAVGKELTIEDFDILHDQKKDSDYAVVTFKEYPEYYLFAGSVLTNVLLEMRDAYGDDVSDQLKKEDVKIKLSTKKSSTKNPVTGMYNQYTAVEVL